VLVNPKQLLNIFSKLSKYSNPYGLLGNEVKLLELLKFNILIILSPQVFILIINDDSVVPLVIIVSQIPEILIVYSPIVLYV